MPPKTKAPERNLAEEVSLLRLSVEQLEQAVREAAAGDRALIEATTAQMNRVKDIAEDLVQRYDRSLVFKAWELFAESIRANSYTRTLAGAVTLIVVLVWSTAAAMRFLDIPRAVEQLRDVVAIGTSVVPGAGSPDFVGPPAP